MKLFVLACSLCLTIGGYSQSITTTDVQSAEKMYRLNFTPAKRDSMLSALGRYQKTYDYFHNNPINNSVSFPLWYSPLIPGIKVPKNQLPVSFSLPATAMPANKNQLAFYSIPQLASLLKSKKITSVQLTRFFIDRFKTYGPALHCVIELTEDLAMQQAKKADAEMAKGIYKGPLHGIPYGIKDLFSVAGTHTTWGTPPYKNQQIEGTSFVAQQLQKAGAVLVAKLSLGELAMDDVWFGGMTRNPWDTSKGSGGSSAGSGSATAAGLVPFAIGTETYGSIVDPAMRCGVTGLRPTYGSVAKTGAMNLAFTSDKIGPLCRSAEDAAIVFNYIQGADDVDLSSIQAAFNYTGKVDVAKLKIAYIKNYIDDLPADSPEKQTLATLQQMGARVTPITFPEDLHGDEILSLIIGAESASAFDELTRTNKDDDMVQQNKDRWPNTFRAGRLVPAEEYITACRLRYRIMEQLNPLINQWDIIIAPPETGDQLALTNLTGHPSITIPNGLMANGMPASISFIGKHFTEATLCAFAQSYQNKTGFHKLHPPMFAH